MTDEPLTHILRPGLPWRVEGRTECGLDGAHRPVMTRDEFGVRLKRLGMQRMAYLTCMTCYDTARRWPTFAEDPARAMGRESYMGRGTDDAFRDELRALAALVERHPDEFASLLGGIGQTVRLADHVRRPKGRAATNPRGL